MLLKKTDNGAIQFLRSLFVGGFATVVDMGALAIMVELCRFDEIVAAVIAFILGLFVNFLLSSFWVFKSSRTKNKTTEFVAFTAVAIIGLVLNLIIIEVFSTYLSRIDIFGPIVDRDKYYLVGKVVATVVVFIWNFFARKIFIYTDKKQSIERGDKQ